VISRLQAALLAPLVATTTACVGITIERRPGNDLPPYAGEVKVVNLAPRTGAEIGAVRLESGMELDRLVAKLRESVASIGGDVAVIDGVRLIAVVTRDGKGNSSVHYERHLVARAWRSQP
jgi:hypothetical protein